MKWLGNTMKLSDFCAYPGRFEKQPDGSFTVTIRGLPGAVTEGDGYCDAFEMARHLLVDWFDGQCEMGPIPPAQAVSTDEIPVPVEPLVAFKVLLHNAMREYDMTVDDLARVTGTSPEVIRQALSFYRHDTPMALIFEIAACLGLKLDVRAR